MKLLFASSEVYPLVKTGGLADACSGLVVALRDLQQEVELVLPAYADAIDGVDDIEQLATLEVEGCGRRREARILRGQVGSLAGPVLLVAIDDLFDRPGNPYQNSAGEDWWDNGERFGLFSRVVAELAMNRAGLDWQPDVVHCHDWQTGLVPAWLQLEPVHPRTLFTIHNLAYAGLFPYELFHGLGLPEAWWHFSGLEFYNNLSMLKAGIVCADQLTTVSPSYAEEICRPEQGFGLHEALQQRLKQGQLHGIINGMDSAVWNPATDPLIPYHYSAKRGRVAQKKRNKQVLLERMGGGPANPEVPLFGFVGRLVEQKGIDLITAVIPFLIESGEACFAIVGTGQAVYEQQLRLLAEQYPRRVFVHIGYSEVLAHLVEAGADLFLMPSRFEPCGLNQMYSQAYGTPPVVHATGGLKDTVVDADEVALAAGDATGFTFDAPEPSSFYDAIERALSLFDRPRRWQQLQKNGMRQDFGWTASARRYLELYKSGGNR
ncbi:MAG: glycogen synthase GlgA [Desulfuromonadales bacterium]|nr:glycogen synthase GlgA [Desulfuromonadales bacterium]